MISIIISSVDARQLAAVRQNIAETIGVAYEIISVNNADGKMGLCRVYNAGVRQAKFDLLCFMHEDIAIHTTNWGKNVVQAFLDNEGLGLLGVAGSDYKSSVIGGCETIVGKTYIHICQHYKHQQQRPTYYNMPAHVNGGIHQVVCVDGVWFCAPRSIALEYPFDENLNGFHGYDIDFSLAVKKKYKVAVSFDILLSHFSEGNFSRPWFDAMRYIHHKRKGALPIYSSPPANISVFVAEKRMFKHLLVKYRKQFNITLTEAIEMLNTSSIRRLSLILYIKLLFYTLRLFVLKK